MVEVPQPQFITLFSFCSDSGDSPLSRVEGSPNIEPGMPGSSRPLGREPSLKNLENTRTIRAVVAAGRLIEKNELQEILEDVECAASHGTPTGR